MSTPPLPTALVADGHGVEVFLPAQIRGCSGCRGAFREAGVPVLPADGSRAVTTRVRCGAHDAVRFSFADGRGTATVTVAIPPDGQAKDTVTGYLHEILRAAKREPFLIEPWSVQLVSRVRAAAEYEWTDEEGVAFALAGWGPQDRASARPQDLTAESAFEWSIYAGLQDLTPQQVIAWNWVEASRPEASLWKYYAGVCHPDDRPDGLTVDETVVLQVAGVEPGPQWAFAPGNLCPDFIAAAAQDGHDPVDVVEVGLWLAGTRSDGSTCGHVDPRGRDVRCWMTAEDSARLLAAARRWHDLDWSVLANCLIAGMGERDAEAYVRGGGDPNAVALLAGLTG